MKTIALVGCPNTGKTSLYNGLTGSHQKVANYAGVTVEKREGFLEVDGKKLRLVDLPGIRGLEPRSRDEEITWEVLRGSWREKGDEEVSTILAVVDATEMDRTLPLVLELLRLGKPVVVAMNMMDLAEKRGLKIDLTMMANHLGAPVIRCSAFKGEGIAEIAKAVVFPSVAREKLEPLGIRAAAEEATRLLAQVIRQPLEPPTLTDRIDRVVLHRVWGPLIGLGVFFCVFQAVFTFAAPFQNWIEQGIKWVSVAVSNGLGEGPLRDLVVDGVFAGVGAVLVFLPQILLLFLLVSLLEDSGYLARAAFLLDRTMRSFGLSGQTFLPMLSSFACAIPGIMATRTIEGRNPRRIAMLTAPLMACSARLPVYTLLISAFVPATRVVGLSLQGLVMFGLYLLGILGAFLIAWVNKRWAEREQHLFLMELPTYKRPSGRNVALALWQRAGLFVRRAGTTIFGLSVILWFLVSFPKGPDGKKSLEHSFAGRVGAVMAPALAPLGFDWRISVALVPGMAAREVMVGALATVLAVESDDEEKQAESLTALLPKQFSLATALALLVWYVFAPQCLSTFAVMRRESGSLRFATLTVVLFFGMAYAGAFVTYQVARLLG